MRNIKEGIYKQPTKLVTRILEQNGATPCLLAPNASSTDSFNAFAGPQTTRALFAFVKAQPESQDWTLNYLKRKVLRSMDIQESAFKVGRPKWNKLTASMRESSSVAAARAVSENAAMFEPRSPPSEVGVDRTNESSFVWVCKKHWQIWHGERQSQQQGQPLAARRTAEIGEGAARAHRHDATATPGL